MHSCHVRPCTAAAVPGHRVAAATTCRSAAPSSTFRLTREEQKQDLEEQGRGWKALDSGLLPAEVLAGAGHMGAPRHLPDAPPHPGLASQGTNVAAPC